MPELPEVETVRRGLQPVMEGATVEKLVLNRPDLRFPFPKDLNERLQGQKIISLGRRAKYLLIEFEDGASLISHLGMSGSYRIEPDLRFASKERTGEDFHFPRSKNPAHDHVVFHLQSANHGQRQVIYNDPRRFGFLLLCGAGELADHPSLKDLGIEPTGNSLSGSVLASLFRDKRVSLKAALLDQRLIAGLGNIYVCEALWRAGLSPLRAAGEVAENPQLAESLATSVREVIAEAIVAGGSSLRDHRQADGTLGYFQHSFAVYDREGEPCRRCGAIVQRIVQNGRSTFFCAACSA
ncbi:bifunctional DNA-formamidopyrimidine glycosylase/DNA-(apurinic or apyrimidinic site) lyase [Pseudochrobactrum sp. sp1633]|uniref:bifunctional DNA-formamidopyrimidine glycosylase/DNA-(apurinic or apyrimidinic site) lyase n=1 Tax=Pseudochrobactrum sp. sp1633 TaxID=3036706 RepID=UPI0025A4CC99|nr:bifunctional DNA-formamidopyrimidine glycosylase/DNA-(apurinic or apyrimidinic site) lyase [Pseudochrobactrum sp. sp1633]MDM8344862.1 bifunctional DNA-formamidopyrimidine glycosylase/DNA-(apurinic or apyrimidinic site) lyase [Pseudochrobactrum sp. sp1633]HWD14695.1 bifunctional DNA-formamidopyrimidine glycosylase/DNA-(apurinic or apyrimidinic site) lyase [Pseudochrobactrum sp.]